MSCYVQHQLPGVYWVSASLIRITPSTRNLVAIYDTGPIDLVSTSIRLARITSTTESVTVDNGSYNYQVKLSFEESNREIMAYGCVVSYE